MMRVDDGAWSGILSPLSFLGPVFLQAALDLIQRPAAERRRPPPINAAIIKLTK
jgi:hypothetical protein